MTTLTLNEKKPRIACYKVPADTLALCALLLVVAGLIRYVGNDRAHQIANGALFLLVVFTSFDFLIAFARPNSITGGAKLATIALAGFAALGLAVLH
jgi:hypothetical protein